MIISAALNQEAMEREFHAAIAAERKADRVGAAMFVRACRDDDPELLNAVDFLNDNTIDGWRLAMVVATLDDGWYDPAERAAEEPFGLTVGLREMYPLGERVVRMCFDDPAIPAFGVYAPE